MLNFFFSWLGGLMMLTGVCALMVSCGRQSPPPVQTVTINNAESRRDVSGQVIDAHDGCLQFFDGNFYLYGTAYGTNDGYGTNNRYRVYRSPDLEHWTYERELFQSSPQGVYYRPYVVFNPQTRKYVLWYNWYARLWDGRTGVATSDSPTGPFSIVSTNVPLHAAVTGDGSLFVDDDGTAYYIYTALNEGGTVRVERLAPDYLSATGETSGILGMGVESPVLFRRGGVYYALMGPRCPFCPEGSEVQYLIAQAPLGPYTASPTMKLNRRPDGDVTGITTQPDWAIAVSSANSTNVNETMSDGSPKNIPMIMRHTNRPLVAGQPTWVAKIPVGGQELFIWMADRWGSTLDGVKGHDFQFWSMPLQFGTNGDILPFDNVAQWHVQWTIRD